MLIRLLISVYYLLLVYNSFEYINTYIENNQIWISFFFIGFALFALAAIPGYFIKKKTLGWISLAFISFLTLYQIGAFFWGLFREFDMLFSLFLFMVLFFVLIINLPIFFYTRKHLLQTNNYSTTNTATE